MHILAKKEFREVYEIIEMLIRYLAEIRWHGNGEKNDGVESHCILYTHKHWSVVAFTASCCGK